MAIILNSEEVKQKTQLLLLGTYREGIDKVVSWLDTINFWGCPASSKHHGNFTGGLAQHCLHVYMCFSQLNDYLQLNIPKESLVICGILHDVCKCGCYVPEFKNKKVYSDRGSKRDAKGNYDWDTVEEMSFNDPLPLGHGSKSVILLSDMIKLTDFESMAIYWHMGPYTDLSDRYSFGNAVTVKPAIKALYLADEMASTFLEETK